MLQLKDIKKTYITGEMEVNALNGVSIDFRKNEFVSILGPSGCGKTTTLNIIGGLDQATDGDLVINGESTKDFKDRDWDAYRNHTVGFVFQSYNLIPHQTVLANVEMALTLTGVGKAERKKRAKEALVKVGLDGQFYKRPSELSGGQMQRVAIARAIVNNPDIILADEPTGALDTTTSVQVMDILKEIAEDRLVIMVTHNPELAEKYSTRIIRMLDGNVVDDTKPLSEAELKQELKQAEKARIDFKKKKPTMSFATSFMLSLKNLFTKKGRTILTSFAGSIGIIGIALIFAVSQGTTNYIAQIQEETLASYPLQIEQQHTDMSSMLTSYIEAAQKDEQHENDAVYRKSVLYNLAYSLSHIETSENDMASFKNYLDQQLADKNSELYGALNGIEYGYNLSLLTYTKDPNGKIIPADTGELMQQVMSTLYGIDITSLSLTGGGLMSSLAYTSNSLTIWQELMPQKDGSGINKLILDQYEVVDGAGRWPTQPNEVVLVVDKNNEIDDLTLYALGLVSYDDIQKIVDAARSGEENETVQSNRWDYNEFIGRTFRTIYNSDCFMKQGNVYVDLRESEQGLDMLYNTPEYYEELTIVGIVRQKQDSTTTILNGSICYLNSFKQKVINHSLSSQIVQEQKQNLHVDVITGLPFNDSTLKTDEQKAQRFDEYVGILSNEQKAKLYVKIKGIPSQEYVDEKVSQALLAYYSDGQIDQTKMAQLRQTAVQMYSTQMGLSADAVQGYVDQMTDEQLLQMYGAVTAETVQKQYAVQKSMELMSKSTDELCGLFDDEMSQSTAENKAFYYENALEFSDSKYEDNLNKMGNVDLSRPSSISFYAVSFADKGKVEDAIANYNKQNPDHEIEYTDYVGLIMSSVTTIIDAVTYVLIAFVAISLIVSSIMIGVITLISVQERTKEIGILRAMGASKRDVSGMFNVETVIIGFASGAFGVIITYLLCIPINAILRALTGIASLKAMLPLSVALILVAISMLLTLVAGLIPSRSAAKKDPVVCLRTE